MPVFMLYVMGFVQKLTKYGRWTDLVVGLATLALGIHWGSPWTIAFGGLGILSFAVDLNGMIQRRTMAFAHSRAMARRRR